MHNSLLYSQRKAFAEGNVSVLQTEILPDSFVVQICHILMQTIGRESRRSFSRPSFSQTVADKAWTDIHNEYRYLKGLAILGEINSTYEERCLEYVTSQTTQDVIDFVEYALQYIDRDVRDWNDYHRYQAHVSMLPDQAISEFNRFATLAGVGYSYTNGEIVTVSSSYLHSQVVEPALVLLRSHGFAAAEQEFMRAHQAFRRGDYQDVLVEATKAFESTIKVIIRNKSWECDPTAAVKKLISCLDRNNYFPGSLQTQFSHFVDLLSSGVPTIGNKNGRHGAGETPHDPSRPLVEYALNLTASNIVFLVSLL